MYICTYVHMYVRMCVCVHVHYVYLYVPDHLQTTFAHDCIEHCLRTVNLSTMDKLGVGPWSLVERLFLSHCIHKLL